MAITRRTDYAVRLMLELAQLPPGVTLSRRDLFEAADIPESFGLTLVELLIASGLILAGGYNGHLLSLARPASAITMASVIRASEPDFSLAQCSRDPHQCNRSGSCAAHPMWADLDMLVWQRLDGVTLGDLTSGTLGAIAREAGEPSRQSAI